MITRKDSECISNFPILTQDKTTTKKLKKRQTEMAEPQRAPASPTFTISAQICSLPQGSAQHRQHRQAVKRPRQSLQTGLSSQRTPVWDKGARTNSTFTQQTKDQQASALWEGRASSADLGGASSLTKTPSECSSKLKGSGSALQSEWSECSWPGKMLEAPPLPNA